MGVYVIDYTTLGSPLSGSCSFKAVVQSGVGKLISTLECEVPEQEFHFFFLLFYNPLKVTFYPYCNHMLTESGR